MIRLRVRNPLARRELVVVPRKGKWYEVNPVNATLPVVGIVDIPGGKVELFTVKVMGEAVDRLAHTIRLWGRSGSFPPALYQLPSPTGRGNIRMYAAWQVVAMNDLYVAMGGRRRGHTRPECMFNLELFFERARTVFYRPDAHIDPSNGEVVLNGDSEEGRREEAEGDRGALGL